jgi:hypothetical protein
MKVWRIRGVLLDFIGPQKPIEGISLGLFYGLFINKTRSLGSTWGISMSYYVWRRNKEGTLDKISKCKIFEMLLMGVVFWIWVIKARHLLGAIIGWP